METQKIVGAVLVLLGLFYALAPHSLHVSSGLGLGLEHNIHMTLGVILLAVGAYAGWMWKAPPGKKKKKR